MQPGFEKLDQRAVLYRFDLEADIPWDRLDAPGLFFNRAYLEALGFDWEGLSAHPAAHERLQRLLALCTCWAFAHLEDDVVRFLEDEHEDVPQTRSALLLLAEEVKHAILFKRFAAALEARFPGLEAALEPHYQPPPGLARLQQTRERIGSKDAVHYLFWLNTLFFEEFTMYLFRTLARDQASIQPAWLEAHRCHLREEAQHVLTDRVYVRSSPLDAEERYRCSKMFCMNLGEDLRGFFSLGAVEAAMRDEWPGVQVFTRPPRLDALPLLGDLLTSPSFALTREAAPYLERFRAEREGAGAGANPKT